MKRTDDPALVGKPLTKGNEMTHTQGLLHYDPTRDNAAGKQEMIDEPIDGSIMSGEMYIARIWSDGENPQEDARRIVACWNACEGLTTEALETPRGMAGAIEPIIIERDRLKAINAELLAALESEWVQARAAIAKANG